MVKKGATKGASSSATTGATGKPPVNPRQSGSTGAAAAVNPQGDWERSKFTARNKKKLQNASLIADAEDIVLPGAPARPNPPPGFTIMFVAYMLRGLSLLAHDFLRGLLFTYGIQLWQLGPNSILYLALFITVCESFLGIEPHFGLWKKIFFLKRHGNPNGLFVVGGIGFSVIPDKKFLPFPMKESIQGWKEKWFYLRDRKAPGADSGLPPFVDELVLKPKKSWRNALTAEELSVADELYARLQEVKVTDGQIMLGTEIPSLFMRRRIQPLQHRSHPMFLYSGPNDPTQISSVPMEEEDIVTEVRRLTKLTKDDDIPLDIIFDPYEAANPPEKVHTLLVACLGLLALDNIDTLTLVL